MFKSYWHQVKLWWRALLYIIPMPFMILLSSAWRRRNFHASQVLANPFWDRSRALSDLLSDPLEVTLVPVRSFSHNTTEHELLALGSLVSQLQATKVFEIGTFDGRTTRTLAANLGQGGRVWTLNLPPGQATSDSGQSNVDSQLNLKVPSGVRFSNTPQSSFITQLYGDSANFDFSPYNGSMDLVFIDGSHTEQYVSTDTAVALQLLAPSGGLVVWHDSLYYGVVTFLKRRILEGWPVEWLEGTTLALGYVQNGKLVPLPCPLPRSTSVAA